MCIRDSMKAVRLYQNVVGQFDLYMGHVATNVAGIYHNPISVEQTDMKACLLYTSRLL